MECRNQSDFFLFIFSLWYVQQRRMVNIPRERNKKMKKTDQCGRWVKCDREKNWLVVNDECGHARPIINHNPTTSWVVKFSMGFLSQIVRRYLSVSVIKGLKSNLLLPQSNGKIFILSRWYRRHTQIIKQPLQTSLTYLYTQQRNVYYSDRAGEKKKLGEFVVCGR